MQQKHIATILENKTGLTSTSSRISFMKSSVTFTLRNVKTYNYHIIKLYNCVLTWKLSH